MANYYTHFAALITGITPRNGRGLRDSSPWRRTGPTPKGRDGPGEDEVITFAREFREDQGGGLSLWLFTDEESGNLEQVGEFVQAFLTGFRPEEAFGMTYADTCSSARPGAFAGGFLYVTKDGYHVEDAHSWLERYRARSRSGSQGS